MSCTIFVLTDCIFDKRMLDIRRIKELKTWRSCWAEGRWAGSFTKHLLIKSTNSLDHLPSFCKRGGGRFGIIKIAYINHSILNCTLIGWIFENGGTPSANSMAVMPKDQISA